MNGPHLGYDTAIAEACEQYQAAREEHSLMRTDETALALRRANAKMNWMIDAKRFNWNVTDFDPSNL